MLLAGSNAKVSQKEGGPRQTTLFGLPALSSNSTQSKKVNSAAKGSKDREQSPPTQNLMETQETLVEPWQESLEAVRMSEAASV